MGDFKPEKHCPKALQEYAGLYLEEFGNIRKGQKTALSKQGKDCFCVSNCIVAPTREQARTIWSHLDSTWRDDPPNAKEAMTVAYVATVAGKNCSEATLTMIGSDEPPVLASQFIGSPGSVLVDMGKDDSARFISFFACNCVPMENGRIVPWYELSGEQQAEWVEAWKNSDRAWSKKPEHVLGLAGTNMVTIKENELAKAAMISPSIAKRKRPKDAEASVDAWNLMKRPKRSLDFWSDFPIGVEEDKGEEKKDEE